MVQQEARQLPYSFNHLHHTKLTDSWKSVVSGHTLSVTPHTGANKVRPTSEVHKIANSVLLNMLDCTKKHHLYLNNIFKTYIPTSEKTHRVSNTQNSRLMPLGKLVLFIPRVIQSRYQKNAAVFNVKQDGTYSCHCALQQ
jgi:hypothetical protein